MADDERRCGDQALTGFFFREARYLHELKLESDDEPSFLCSPTWADTHRLEHTYIYPPVGRALQAVAHAIYGLVLGFSYRRLLEQ